MAERRIQSPQPAPEAQSHRLREVAGRIGNLSYREMQTFAKAISIGLPEGATPEIIAAALLNAADLIARDEKTLDPKSTPIAGAWI
jgi:hypothetical protein